MMGLKELETAALESGAANKQELDVLSQKISSICEVDAQYYMPELIHVVARL